MKPLLGFLFVASLVAGLYYILSTPSTYEIKSPNPYHKTKASPSPIATEYTTISTKVKSLSTYLKKGFNTKYAFLINMRLPSGKKRFFVYDFEKDTVVAAGLVAHGSCRTHFLEQASFSNVPECGCSSVGKYKVDYKYEGQFGTAFKLRGLDSTNSNAFARNIVLHAYDCVPDEEVYPLPICNSLGCPMVSYKFKDTLTSIIEKSKKPILLWIYD